jgi:hypothetical protein
MLSNSMLVEKRVPPCWLQNDEPVPYPAGGSAHAGWAGMATIAKLIKMSALTATILGAPRPTFRSPRKDVFV